MSAIYKILGQLLYMVYNIVDNYAISIVLFTIIVKVLMVPLTLNQLKSSKKMQEMQPKIQELQKKYKNNQEQLNTKLMELYKDNKFNPMAGCLPMLIQFPILIGLFGVLRNPLEYVFSGNAELANAAINAPFLWLNNLVDPDLITIGGFGIPGILPILAAITTYFSMNSMQPSTGGAEQPQMLKTMNMLMPFMILLWGRSFPAGLMVYWAISNTFQMAQQFLINKAGNKPKEEL